MPEETEELVVERRGRVAVLTLNRPERRNALSASLTTRLLQVLTEVDADPDVWAVVLTGAGDRAFCAGGDLKEFDELARAGHPIPVPMTGPERNLYEAVLEVGKPTVALLNGPAVAGGCELALACDLRIAAEHATLGMPEARIGMGANFATVLLPRLAPRAIAMQLLYTAEPITAQEALRWGLYNVVVPGDELETAGFAMVDTIVANAPLTLRRYKAMLVKGWELPVAAALRLDAGPNPYRSEDREEGIRAFLEKRPPQWKGR